MQDSNPFEYLKSKMKEATQSTTTNFPRKATNKDNKNIEIDNKVAVPKLNEEESTALARGKVDLQYYEELLSTTPKPNSQLQGKGDLSTSTEYEDILAKYNNKKKEVDAILEKRNQLQSNLNPVIDRFTDAVKEYEKTVIWNSADGKQSKTIKNMIDEDNSNVLNNISTFAKDVATRYQQNPWMRNYVDIDENGLFTGMKKDYQKLMRDDIKKGIVTVDQINKVIKPMFDNWQPVQDLLDKHNQLIKDEGNKYYALTPEFQDDASLIDRLDNKYKNKKLVEMQLSINAFKDLMKDPGANKRFNEQGLDAGINTLEEQSVYANQNRMTNQLVPSSSYYTALAPKDLHELRMLKGYKAVEETLNESRSTISGLRDVMGNTLSQVVQGALDDTVGLLFGATNLFVQPKDRDSWKIKNVTDKLYTDLRDSGLSQDVVLTAMSLHNQNRTPIMSNIAKFFNDAGYQTGTMLPFIMSLSMMGANAGMVKMLEAGEKMTVKQLFGSQFLLKEVLPVYGKSAVAGIWNTFPKYAVNVIDNLKGSYNATWLDWVGGLSISALQSSMEGMSEVTSAHFLGKAIGKITNPLIDTVVGKQLFNGSIVKRAMNYFLADNIGEVMEERINDLTSVEFINTVRGKTYTDEEGNVRDGWGDFLKDELKKSMYEYAMFMFSSGLQTIAVNSPKSIMEDVRFQKFANFQLDKIENDAKLKGLNISRTDLEKTVKSLYNIVMTDKAINNEDAQNKGVEYLQKAIKDENQMAIYEKSGLTEEQIIYGINKNDNAEHFDKYGESIAKMSNGEFTKETLNEVRERSNIEYNNTVNRIVENAKSMNDTDKLNFVIDNKNTIQKLLNIDDATFERAVEMRNYDGLIHGSLMNQEKNRQTSVLQKMRINLARTTLQMAEKRNRTALVPNPEPSIDFSKRNPEVLNSEQGSDIKGINIVSNTSGLGGALTNPTSLAKSKGNINQDYPITYNGQTYIDVEQAYKKFKNNDTEHDYKLMTDLIEIKLKSFPILTEEITKQGGIEFLNKSSHSISTNYDAKSRWTGKGQNSLFIKSLTEAYNRVVPQIKVGNTTPDIKKDDIINQSNVSTDKLHTTVKQFDTDINKVLEQMPDYRSDTFLRHKNKIGETEGTSIHSEQDIKDIESIIPIKEVVDRIRRMIEDTLNSNPINAGYEFDYGQDGLPKQNDKYYEVRDAIESAWLQYIKEGNWEINTTRGSFNRLSVGMFINDAIKSVENIDKVIDEIDTFNKSEEGILLKKKVIDFYNLEHSNREDYGNNYMEYATARNAVEYIIKKHDLVFNPNEAYAYNKIFISEIGKYNPMFNNIESVEGLAKNLYKDLETFGKHNFNEGYNLSSSIINRTHQLHPNKFYFKLYPQPSDINWVSDQDVYSGSYKTMIANAILPKYPTADNIYKLNSTVYQAFQKNGNESSISLTKDNFYIEGDYGYLSKEAEQFVVEHNKRFLDRVSSEVDKEKYPNFTKFNTIEEYDEWLSKEHRDQYVDTSKKNYFREESTSVLAAIEDGAIPNKLSMLDLYNVPEMRVNINARPLSNIDFFDNNLNAWVNRDVPRPYTDEEKDLMEIARRSAYHENIGYVKNIVNSIELAPTIQSDGWVVDLINRDYRHQIKFVKSTGEYLLLNKTGSGPMYVQTTKEDFDETKALVDKAVKFRNSEIDRLGTPFDDLPFSQQTINGKTKTTGAYFPGTKHIELYWDAIKQDANPPLRYIKTLAHEKLHMVSDYMIGNGRTKFAIELGAMLDYYKEHGNKESEHYKYIFKTDNRYIQLQEFNSAMFTEEAMQIESNNLQYTRKGKVAKFFDAFISLLGKYLSSMGMKVNDNSLLKSVIELNAETVETLFPALRQTNAELSTIRQEHAQVIGDSDLKGLQKEYSEQVNDESQKDARVAEALYDEMNDSETINISFMMNQNLQVKGMPLFENQLEGINFAKSTTLEEFKKLIDTVDNIDQKNELYTKKYPVSSFAEYAHALLRSTASYTVATIKIDTGVGNVSDVQEIGSPDKVGYYRDNSNNDKSTLMRNQLFDVTVRSFQRNFGVNMIIMPITMTNLKDRNGDFMTRIGNEKNYMPWQLTDDTFVQLYEKGYFLIPNKNTQYLVKVDSVQGTYEQTEDPLQNIRNFWKVFLQTTLTDVKEGETGKWLKRFNNMMGDGTKAYIYKGIKQLADMSGGRFRVDGNKLNINTAVLTLDIENLPEDVSEMFKQWKDEMMGDGAVFESKDLHNIMHVVNSVSYDKWGNAIKYKVSDEGLLIKCAAFKAPPMSPLEKFMEVTGIERIIINSALKIDGQKDEQGKITPRYGTKITWQNILDTVEQGKPTFDQSAIVEHDIMEDAFMFAKGKTKKFANGHIGSLITNSLTTLLKDVEGKSFQKIVEEVWKEQGDEMKSYLNNLSSEDKVDMIEEFLDNNTNLATFNTGVEILNMIKLSGTHFNDFNALFSDFFNKNILSKYIIEKMRHQLNGVCPVLTPDMGHMTNYHGQIYNSLVNSGMATLDIETFIKDNFHSNGFIKDGRIILDWKNAQRLGITWEKIKEGIEIIGTVNPPGSFSDTRVLKVIGITPRTSWYYNGEKRQDSSGTCVVSYGDYIALSGKDFDIDTLILWKNDKWASFFKDKDGNIIDHNKKQVDMMKAFDEKIIDKPEYIGTIDNMKTQLNMNVPQFYYQFAKIFGLKNAPLDINDLTRTTNLLNGDGIINIGRVYNMKIYNQIINEWFRNNPNEPQIVIPCPSKGQNAVDGMEMITIARGTMRNNYNTNLVILKHLTDLTIDWLSDQRILNLNIDEKGIKVYEKLFNLNDYQATLLKKGLEYWLLDIRNTVKDVNDVQSDSDNEGMNKLRDLLNKADKKLNDKDNPFKDSLLFKGQKYMIRSLRESNKLALTADEIRRVEQAIFNNMGVTIAENPKVLDFLYSYNVIGNANRLKGLKDNEKYDGYANNGKANMAFAIDKWNQFMYGRPIRNKIAGKYVNPFYDFVKSIFDKQAFFQDKEFNKNHAYFYTNMRETAFAHFNNFAHSIYHKDGIVHFAYELRDKNRDGMLIKTMFTANNIEDYKDKLIAEGKLSPDMAYSIFNQTQLANWFDVIAMKTSANRNILKDLSFSIIGKLMNDSQFTKKLDDNQKYGSPNHKKLTRETFYKSLIGMADGGKVDYGMNFYEYSTTIADGKGAYLMKNNSVGFNKLSELANTDEVAMKVLKEYVKADYEATQQFTIQRPDALYSEQLHSGDIHEDLRDATHFSRNFLMTYTAVVRKEAQRNGYVVDNRDMFRKIPYIAADGIDKFFSYKFVYDIMNQVEGQNINGNSIDYAIKYRLHGEFEQSQQDMSMMSGEIHNILAKDLGKVGISKDAGLIQYMEQIAAKISEGDGGYMDSISFDSEGNLVHKGVKYQIFANTSMKKNARNQNTLISTNLLNAAKSVLGDNILFEDKQGDTKDMSIRTMMAALANRYVYDYYTPGVIRDFNISLEKYKAEVIDKMPNTPIKESLLITYIGIAERTMQMENQIKGRREVLKQMGRYYLPHTISDKDVALAELIVANMNDGMTEEVATRVAMKELSMGEYKNDLQGGINNTIDVNFLKNGDKIKSYDTHSVTIAQQYLRKLNEYMRKQTIDLYSISNLQYLHGESPGMRKERLINDAILTGRDMYWTPTSFEKLRPKDWIMFTHNGEFISGRIELIKNGEVHLHNNKLKFFRTTMGNIRIQRGNDAIARMKMNDRWARSTSNLENVLDFAIQWESRVLLGMENTMFGVRNWIAGKIEQRLAVGKLKDNVSARLKEFEQYAKGQDITSEEWKKMYDIVIEYHGLIRGSMDSFFGAFAGIITELNDNLSPETIQYYEQMKKDLLLDNKYNDKLLLEMKNMTTNNLPNLNILQKFVKITDRYYQKWGLYSFPLGIMDKKGWMLVDSKVIVPTVTENFLRDSTAIMSIMSMMEQWDWDERIVVNGQRIHEGQRKNSDEFRKFFYSELAGNILRNVRNSQVSYTGQDRARIDSSKLWKTLITQFGHYSITQQANYIQGWKNVITQFKRHGLTALLSANVQEIANVIELGEPTSYKVRTEFRRVIGKTGAAAISELLGACVVYGGETIIDLFTDGFFSVFFSTLIKGAYIPALSKNSAIPMLTIPLRVLFIMLSLKYGSDPEDEDTKLAKMFKKIMDNTAMTPERFSDKHSKLNMSDSELEFARLQKMKQDAVSRNLPGLGINRMADLVGDLFLMSYYDGSLGEWTFNTTKAYVPFSKILMMGNDVLDNPLPFYYKQDAVSTRKNVLEAIKKAEDKDDYEKVMKLEDMINE